MTPIRVVYAADMDTVDVDNLRDQVDMALQDPDYSIIANFEIQWQEMGSEQRLLDLTSEYDLTDRQLYAGLGVTESLLSGESSYSGDRINLEVINTRYMLLRENLQNFIETYMLAPMCRRMGFVEEVDGEMVPIVPPVSFTRLSLRDSADTFDQMFNLYQKGSLDIGTILENLNLDKISVKEALEKDLFTLNDSLFNEFLRGIYGDAGRSAIEKSNLTEKLIEYLNKHSSLKGGLEYKEPDAGGTRF
jgi:hypothetical protein